MRSKVLKSSRILWLVLLVAAFGFGFLLRGGNQESKHEISSVEAQQQAEVWTCSMHPQIQLPKPGKCPICFMNLIPVETGLGGPDAGERRLVMSESARKLAEIQTTAVRRRVPVIEIRMVGKVDYDETRLVHVTAWVPGRLDRLYVDYTGIQVRKGDHMVYLYSPDLLAAQQELLEAAKAARRLQRSDLPRMRETAAATVDAARDKLRLWGLTPEQISEIEVRGKPSDHTTVFAPTGGIVVEKHVTEGMYVDVGTRIYTIADLSQVWVILDAYESDMAWLRYGQEVEFETEAYPGEVFRGRITFIDPVLNARTRTVRVRVNVANANLRLKPEMFVRAVVSSHVAAGGRVVDPDFSGKWICPMHPEVVSNHSGQCSECGMDLVTAKSLGYAAVDTSELQLVVPASAVLVTGQRAVVYVEVPDAESPTYEGREIVLGSRAGDDYMVKSGLREGERVVTQGSFKIDSALQIQAKPSMMSPESVVPTATFERSLSQLYETYFTLHLSLAGDDLAAARAAFEQLGPGAGAARMQALQGQAHSNWMQLAAQLKDTAKRGARAPDLDAARTVFHEVSKQIVTIEQAFGHAGDEIYFTIHCPMAFDNQGADWLQRSAAVKNPYFGARMARCGSVKDRFPPRSEGR